RSANAKSAELPEHRLANSSAALTVDTWGCLYPPLTRSRAARSVSSRLSRVALIRNCSPYADTMSAAPLLYCATVPLGADVPPCGIGPMGAPPGASRPRGFPRAGVAAAQGFCGHALLPLAVLDACAAASSAARPRASSEPTPPWPHPGQ